METVSGLQAELAIVRAKRKADNPQLALYEALLEDRLRTVQDDEREEATALLTVLLRL